MLLRVIVFSLKAAHCDLVRLYARQQGALALMACNCRRTREPGSLGECAAIAGGCAD
jgi:hypothetical protein